MLRNAVVSRVRAVGVTILLIWGVAVGSVHAASDVLDIPAKQSAHAQSRVLLAVSRAGNRLVSVGERGIVVLSDDNGQTWRQARVPVSVSLTNMRFVTPATGWAVGHSGVVLKTTDGGESWVKQLDGAQAADLVLDSAKALGATKSEAVRNQLADAERLVADGPDKPFLDLYFADENRGLIIGAYGLAFATEDGGKHWQPWLDRIPNPRGKHLYSIRAVGRDLYIAGEQGALYRSSDGGKFFSELSTPYSGTYFGILAGMQGELVVFGLRGNAYRSEDSGQNWSKVDSGSPATLADGVKLSDGSLLLVDQAGQVLLSRDRGKHFRRVPQLVSRAGAGPLTGIVQAADGALIVSGAHGVERLDLPSTLAE